MQNAKCKMRNYRNAHALVVFLFEFIYNVGWNKKISKIKRSLSSLFLMRWYREGARNPTAPCGRNRECELAQRSKLCEVNSEQTILGTASGLNLTGCYRYSFKRGNNIFTISAVVGSSLSVIRHSERRKNEKPRYNSHISRQSRRYAKRANRRRK